MKWSAVAGTDRRADSGPLLAYTHEVVVGNVNIDVSPVFANEQANHLSPHSAANAGQRHGGRPDDRRARHEGGWPCTIGLKAQHCDSPGQRPGLSASEAMPG